MLETGGISNLVVVGSNPDTLRTSLKYFRIYKLKLLLLNEAQFYFLFPLSAVCYFFRILTLFKMGLFEPQR